MKLAGPFHSLQASAQKLWTICKWVWTSFKTGWPVWKLFVPFWNWLSHLETVRPILKLVVPFTILSFLIYSEPHYGTICCLLHCDLHDDHVTDALHHMMSTIITVTVPSDFRHDGLCTILHKRKSGKVLRKASVLSLRFKISNTEAGVLHTLSLLLLKCIEYVATFTHTQTHKHGRMTNQFPMMFSIVKFEMCSYNCLSMLKSTQLWSL